MPYRRLFAFLLTVFFLAPPVGATQDDARLPPSVAHALKAAGIPPSAVGIVVQEAGGAKSRLEVNARQALNPASLMKLLTTLAALETLGPAYTWRTEVLAAAVLGNGAPQDVLAGDLYLRGAGDPKLTYDRLWLLLRELRARGLREIRGDLVLDRNAFARAEHDPAAFDGKPMRPYNVGPDALLFNFATVHLTLVPQAGAVRVLAEPLPAGYEIVNRLRLVERPSCGEWREALEARIAPHQILLAGDFPLVCGEKRWHLAGLPNAILLYGSFVRLWQELGGQFAGQLKEGVVPAGAVPLAAAESPALGEIVRDINKYSNNVMAQQLYLSLGRKLGADGTPNASATPTAAEIAVRAWLAERKLDFPELVIDNGAGLSRRSRIAPISLARLLQAGWSGATMPEFVASLPIAASDGTTKKKFKGGSVAGQAHLKTGSLEGVRGIAGYLLDRAGRRQVVVFMVNHPKAGEAQPAFDALLEWLWHGAA